MNGTDAETDAPGAAHPAGAAAAGARDWTERLSLMEVVELDPVQPLAAVMAALSEVPDPELGLDIVALGLVYELHLMGENATILMTLTTPGCPMHGSIRRDVLRALEALPGMGYVDVQLVWDPPWAPSRISEEGRRQLYWL